VCEPASLDSEEKILSTLDNWKRNSELLGFYNSKNNLSMLYTVIEQIADYVKDALVRCQLATFVPVVDKYLSQYKLILSSPKPLLAIEVTRNVFFIWSIF
jgi:hypothetical protein